MAIFDELIALAAKGVGVMKPGDIGYDPRFGLRKGDIPRMDGLQVTRESFGNQVLRPLEAKDVEGRGLIFTEADRTAAGGTITDVNGVPMEPPVNLYGGTGYALDNPGKGFASGKGIVTNIKNKAKIMKELSNDKNPLLVPFTMAPTGNDFATMTGSTMLSYAKSALSGKVKRELNKALKGIDEDWVGVDSPLMIDHFQSLSATMRKTIQATMDRDFRDKGGLSLPEARLAVSDALQLDADDLTARTFIEIDPDKATVATKNPSYDESLIGEYVGTAPIPISVLDLATEYSARRGMTGEKFANARGDVRANEAYSLKQTRPAQKADNNVVDTLLKRGAALGIPAATLLGQLGIPQEAQAGQRKLKIPGGFDTINLPAAKRDEQRERAARVRNSKSSLIPMSILEFLDPLFLSPQVMGDGTMDAVYAAEMAKTR